CSHTGCSTRSYHARRCALRWRGSLGCSPGAGRAVGAASRLRFQAGCAKIAAAMPRLSKDARLPLFAREIESYLNEWSVFCDSSQRSTPPPDETERSSRCTNGWQSVLHPECVLLHSSGQYPISCWRNHAGIRDADRRKPRTPELNSARQILHALRVPLAVNRGKGGLSRQDSFHTAPARLDQGKPEARSSL